MHLLDRQAIDTCETVVTILSEGLLGSVRAAAALAYATKHGKAVLPVFVEGLGFQFPTDEVLDVLAQGSHFNAEELKTVHLSGNLDSVAAATKTMLTVIAEPFTQHGSIDVMNGQTLSIYKKAKKINAGGVSPISDASKRAPTFPTSSKEQGVQAPALEV